MKNELIFLGGIESSKWLDDGKTYSRNYHQGYRVYSSNGITGTIQSSSVGGLGGYTGLYLVENKHEIK